MLVVTWQRRVRVRVRVRVRIRVRVRLTLTLLLLPKGGKQPIRDQQARKQLRRRLRVPLVHTTWAKVRSGRFEPTVWVLCTTETGLDLRALAPRHQKTWRSSFEMPIHIGELDVEDYVRVRWHEARKAALAVGEV